MNKLLTEDNEDKVD